MKLLTLGNPKILKGQKRGYLSAVLHLAPHTLSGYNVCPKATAGCAAACLNTAGRGGIGLDKDGLNAIQRARIAKTRRLMGRESREAFMWALYQDIEALIRKAEREGLIPCVRLNGTSDLRWEKMPVRDPKTGLKFPNLMQAFPDLQFYDYTKLPNRRDLPANYHLTFSLAENNDADAQLALANGMNVAVVVRDPAKPRAKSLSYPLAWRGLAVTDGDDSDLRFLDPVGCYVFLRAKGRACTDDSGFVREIGGMAK